MLRTCARLREIARLGRNPLRTTWFQRLRRGSYLNVECGACDYYNRGSWSEPLDSSRWYKTFSYCRVRQRACEPRELNDRHFRISLRRTLHRRDVFWHARLNVGLVARMVIIDVYEVKLNAKSEVANITTLLKLQSWWTCALGIETVQRLPPFLQLLLWLYTRLYNAVRRSTIFSAFKW